MTKEQLYDRDIAPLMDQLIALTKQHGIACLCSFAIHGPGGGDTADQLYCTTYLPDGDGKFDPVLARAIRAVRIIDR